jgi:hypothetical protein
MAFKPISAIKSGATTALTTRKKYEKKYPHAKGSNTMAMTRPKLNEIEAGSEFSTMGLMYAHGNDWKITKPSG